MTLDLRPCFFVEFSGENFGARMFPRSSENHRNLLPFPADIVTPNHKITLDLRPYYLPEMLRRCISYIDRRSLTLYN